MSISGMEFYVLADHFLIHKSHIYAEKARATEVLLNCDFHTGSESVPQRGYNRKLYLDFQEELCLNSVHTSLRQGGYNTTLALSIHQLCMLPRIADSMAQVILRPCVFSGRLTQSNLSRWSRSIRSGPHQRGKTRRTLSREIRDHKLLTYIFTGQRSIRARKLIDK